MARRRQEDNREEGQEGAEQEAPQEYQPPVGDVDWDDIAAEAPTKEEAGISVDKDDGMGVSDAEASYQAKTDIQAIVEKSFPKGLGGDGTEGKIIDAVQVARVYPESFMALMRLGVKSDYRKSNRRKPFSVYTSLTKWYTVFSIPLEGRSRVELAEYAGATREAQKASGIGAGLHVI